MVFDFCQYFGVFVACHALQCFVVRTLKGNTANHNIEGYFGMADYDYSNKYYLSAAFRRDGTSRFLDRWGNFWSVGAAWRISNEALCSDSV